MRLDETAFLPRFASGVQNWASALTRQLQLYLQRTAQQVNLISEGRIAGVTNAGTAAPTTGKWIAGDLIRNSAPTALGGGDAILGWLCVESGEPGTWLEIHIA